MSAHGRARPPAAAELEHHGAWTVPAPASPTPRASRPSRASRASRAPLVSLAPLVALLVVLATAPACTTATTRPGPGHPPAVAAVSSRGEVTTVTRVIDGDTFVVDGHRKIRVLGEDSCEIATGQGVAAAAEATRLLLGQPVRLTREPGVDEDRYGRDLRYVGLADGRDFATVMVAADHSAVYAGHNDANPDYLARLAAADPNGRTCGPDHPRR